MARRNDQKSQQPPRRAAAKKPPLKARPRPAHPGEAEKIAERRHRIFELRKAGGSYAAIGAAVGVDKSTVCRDIQAVMAELAVLTGEAAEDAKALELERLDRLWAGLEAKGLKRGDPRAVQAAVRISERRAKLLGLDQPKKVEVTLPPERGLSPDELDALIQQKQAAIAAAERRTTAAPS